MIKIVLKTGKDEAVRRFHPWIFSGAVKKIYGNPMEGDVVEVFDNKDNFLGCGHYGTGSIAVRLLAFKPETIAYEFWLKKISAAFLYRQKCGIADNPNFNVYRLVHAEGDGLPGLIVDYYNGHVVIQAHSIGMHKNVSHFTQILSEIFGDKLVSVYDKSADTLPAAYGAVNKYLYGNPADCTVDEYGYLFNIDYLAGQKTGFFIDQRENRRLLKQYVEGKNVLNTFCYSGGFSVYALKAGASLVHSVDSSKKAIQLTEQNIVLNKLEEHTHQSFASDTLEFLKNTPTKYDVIILDPPAYAKHRDVKHNAVQGYKRLNAEAIEKINSGGMLFTFSCSQVVDMQLFKSTVIAAAIKAGRKTKIIHQLVQAPDHPVNAFHPESEYLKGLVLFID